MNNLVDRLECPAGAATLMQEWQYTGDGPYYYVSGIRMLSPVGLETPDAVYFSWWMPPVFKAQTRKVLRMIFSASTKGNARFDLTTRTYEEGDYENTVSLPAQCTLYVDMTSPVTVYFVVDVECNTVIDTAVSNLEMDLDRRVYDRGEQDPLDDGEITFLNARFLSADEAAAAYAAGTVRPWF